jgi:flagellar motor switch protein FliN/FliY
MADSTSENASDAAANAAELLAAAIALDSPAGESGPTASTSPNESEKVDPLATLPIYARELLQIEVPVTVTLASQRKSVHEIIELGPGAIVKFEKTCDEPLGLYVGSREIAIGEVVKVGDKFGLRIGRMV